jgi:hypothetical protein
MMRRELFYAKDAIKADILKLNVLKRLSLNTLCVQYAIVGYIMNLIVKSELYYAIAVKCMVIKRVNAIIMTISCKMIPSLQARNNQV